MEQATSKNGGAGNFYVPIVTLTTLFFMWGFITCMNDLLIPYLKNVFVLTHFQSNLVQLAFFAAYFIISLLYFIISAVFGDPIFKIGYKNTIILGLLISATSCFLFYLEASSDTPVFNFFLLALFMLGTGFTFLQIAANPLVAMLGRPETSSSRLNLSQGFNSLGTTLAPVVGGYFIFKFFDGSHGASAVQIPYLVLASVLLFLAGVMFFTDIPKMANEEDDVDMDRVGALKYPHLVFGMLGIFCYVGAEVAIGSNLVSYMKEFHALDEVHASTLLSFYWGGAMIGRFMGSISMSNIVSAKKYVFMFLASLASFFIIFKVTGVDLNDVLYYIVILILNYVVFVFAKSMPSRTLGLFAVANIILLLCSLLIECDNTMWFILSIGLFNSIMFSNIFTLAIDGLGKYTSQGSSLLVMMILGGAVVPPIQGYVADATNSHFAFAVPLVCYAYLVWYGFVGYKVGRIRKD